ncbi:MAG TPA: HPF/RaiA family ribosome-associated protein [Oscillatoriales cyanobacterium M4454_W2019_049]|nr:HPF/RaiA family ribosome-associated protein [Oscillatoriales cyanobacterium M4454_W2019_049]
MKQHIIFHQFPETQKDAFRAYWADKQPRIERLLSRYPDDQRHLRLSVWSNEKGSLVRAVLTLSTGTLVAQSREYTPTWQAAIDEMSERLAKEIRRHKGRLQQHKVHHHRDLNRTSLEAAGKFLEENAARGDRNAFFDLLRPLLRNLKHQARRELIFAQLEGKLMPHEMSVADLLDEVILRAWEQFDSRPVDQSLDQWLSQLTHDIIDEKSIESAPINYLSTPVPSEDERYEADDGWVIENEPFWGNPTPLTLNDVLPDHEIPEPWQELDVLETERWILDRLGSLPKAQRRAFTLHVLEGWDTAEIAMLQRRSIPEVETDIQATREFLIQQLQTNNKG